MKFPKQAAVPSLVTLAYLLASATAVSAGEGGSGGTRGGDVAPARVPKHFLFRCDVDYFEQIGQTLKDASSSFEVDKVDRGGNSTIRLSDLKWSRGPYTEARPNTVGTSFISLDVRENCKGEDMSSVYVRVVRSTGGYYLTAAGSGGYDARKKSVVAEASLYFAPPASGKFDHDRGVITTMRVGCKRIR